MRPQSYGGYITNTLLNGVQATGAGKSLECIQELVGTYAVVTCQVTGLSGDTITWQASKDGTNWYSVRFTNLGTDVAATTATADGIYRMTVLGIEYVRPNVTAYSAGTITVLGTVSS